MGTFGDPILGGDGGELIRDSIHSENYVPSTAGWSIDRDGDAEFNDVTIRGTVEVEDPDGSYVRIYDEDPGDGAVVELGLPTATGPNLSPARLRTGTDPISGAVGLQLRGPSYGVAPADPGQLTMSPSFTTLAAEFLALIVQASGDFEIAIEDPPGTFSIITQIYKTGGGAYQFHQAGTIFADDFQAGTQSLGRGSMAAPQTETLSGTATTTGASATEVRDAVLGSYTFTADVNRSYVVHYHGVKASVDAAATPNLVTIRVRDGGNAVPTTASPIVAEGAARLVATGGPGQVTIKCCSYPRSFSTGTHILGAFTVGATAAGTITPVGDRGLWVEDVSD